MPKSKKIGARGVGRGLGISSRGALRLAHAQMTAGVKPFQYVTMVYPFAFTSSSVTAGVWYWQFRINSLFDPDFTGGGQQPTTFDQWMALYDRYRVLGCDVDCTVSDSTLLNPLIAAGAPSQDAVPTLTFQGIMGLRDAQLAKQPYPATTHIHRTILIKDVFGVDEEAMMSEQNYSGTSSTSAPSVAYFSLGVQSAASTGSVFCAGTLRFAVRLESPHANNISLSRAIPKELASSSHPAPLPPCLADDDLSIYRRFAEEQRARLERQSFPTSAAVLAAATVASTLPALQKGPRVL